MDAGQVEKYLHGLRWLHEREKLLLFNSPLLIFLLLLFVLLLCELFLKFLGVFSITSLSSVTPLNFEQHLGLSLLFGLGRNTLTIAILMLNTTKADKKST